MFVVGLTGGIGSGKSVVGRLFADLGITVVDADQAARAVVEPGTPALKHIATHFGEGILTSGGELDRAALRQRIFSDATAKQWLENLLHPLINEWLQQQLQNANSPYAILESPLLLEIGQSDRVDRVLVVDVPEAVQLERAMARDNNDESQIKAIIASQIPRHERLARADDVIDNRGSLDDLKSQVAQLHETYLRLVTSAPCNA
jgi:dephospho-CoA kinase